MALFVSIFEDVFFCFWFLKECFEVKTIFVIYVGFGLGAMKKQ